MFEKLIVILEMWNIDVHNISFKHYDNFVEVLVNEHYIIILNKAN